MATKQRHSDSAVLLVTLRPGTSASPLGEGSAIFALGTMIWKHHGSPVEANDWFPNKEPISTLSVTWRLQEFRASSPLGPCVVFRDLEVWRVWVQVLMHQSMTKDMLAHFFACWFPYQSNWYPPHGQVLYVKPPEPCLIHRKSPSHVLFALS